MLTPVARSRLFSLIAVCLVLIAVGFLYFRNASGTSGPGTLIGNEAASFTLPATVGPPRGLTELRGHIVVLNLWASWCPPCRAEMPDLQRFWLANQKSGIIVVGVDEGESATAAATFAHSLGVTYPILIDEEQRYGRVYSALGLPTTTIIDRNGIVRAAFDGPVSQAQLSENVKGL